MTKVTPFLMLNDQLEAVMAFYSATFPDSKIKQGPKEGTGRDGSDDADGQARRGGAGKSVR